MKSKTFTNKMKILLLGSTGMLGTAVEKVCRNRNIECNEMFQTLWDSEEK